LKIIEDEVLNANAKGYGRISPFFIPRALINLAPAWVSIKYGFLGPNESVVSACATGAHCIDMAAKLIRDGDADVVVCGGAESAVCPVGIGGFAASRALSTAYENEPSRASRPWDKNRDGFVMGEGAGILVLEDYEHAKKRGATILAEFASAGSSGDSYHITAPEPNGRGARLAMRTALQKAGISGGEIDYVNAHGTSTPAGDMIELMAVAQTLNVAEGSKKLMSSTKSSTGHLLGAAGSLEAIICIKAMLSGVIPPTLNLDDPEDEAIKLFDLVAHKPKEADIKYAMSNSFGFGGTNVSLIFKKFS
jgi:3-oxoacyl-[acyl-carrier-protein] synthase II